MSCFTTVLLMVGLMKKTLSAMRVNLVVNIYNMYMIIIVKQRVGLTRPSFVPRQVVIQIVLLPKNFCKHNLNVILKFIWIRANLFQKGHLLMLCVP